MTSSLTPENLDHFPGEAQLLEQRQAAEALFAERARVAMELLEQVREQRALLASLDDEVRARLLRAAGEVARPDPWAKRELARAAQRKRKEELRARDELAPRLDRHS